MSLFSDIPFPRLGASSSSVRTILRLLIDFLSTLLWADLFTFSINMLTEHDWSVLYKFLKFPPMGQFYECSKLNPGSLMPASFADCLAASATMVKIKFSIC